MAFKKKKSKEAPGITTASLPDIVFMLLCFFMVVTKMRDSEMKVKIELPQATELKKLEQKSLVNHIYLGVPVEEYRSVYGTQPILQLSDQLATVDDIPAFIENVESKVDPRQISLLTTALKVDGEVKMGKVTEVKTALRKIDRRKISYLANEGGGSN